MMNIGELPQNDPKGRVQMWGFDSGIQSGATTAVPSIAGQTNDNNNQVGTIDWNREYTMDEVTRKSLLFINI